MAISVQVLDPRGPLNFVGYGIVCNAAAQLIVAITNPAADAARTITSISVAEITESEATIAQPNYLTAGAAPGTGLPVISPGTTLYFPFAVVFNSPNFPGVSPGNQPGGTAPGNRAMEADANFNIQATVVTADGQVVAGSLMVPVLSAIAPTPSLQGGALQLNNPMNLVTYLTMFA